MKNVCSGDGVTILNIAHTRRASDWKAPPVAQETSGADESSAYHDNAESLAAEALDNVVRRLLLLLHAAVDALY